MPHKVNILILFISAKIKEIFSLGRDYPWPKPELCPCCKQSKLWGHGFVPAYFDGFVKSVFLRRYRCPGCGSVIRLRPQDYYSRFQAPIKIIRSTLSYRLHRGRWPPFFSRSRGGHWLRALRRKVEAYLSKNWKKGLLTGFDHLHGQGKIPVSRSI